MWETSCGLLDSILVHLSTFSVENHIYDTRGIFMCAKLLSCCISVCFSILHRYSGHTSKQETACYVEEKLVGLKCVLCTGHSRDWCHVEGGQHRTSEEGQLCISWAWCK